MTRVEDGGASAYGLGLPGAVPVESDDLAMVTLGIFTDVMEERERQLAKWGDQHHEDGTGGPRFEALAGIKRSVTEAQARHRPDGPTWLAILDKEVHEAFAESDPEALDKELVQTIASLVAWLVDLRRRK